jgi:hypothetical protein
VGAASASTGAFTTLTASTSLNIASSTTVDGVLDEDDMSSDSATKLATQQSIKAYVDSQVGTVDTWAEVLANGATSGATNPEIDSGQALKTNTINETTAGSGVTIDSVLLKDDSVNAATLEVSTLKANDGTAAGSIADSTGVVTLNSVDINGGNIDGTTIGATVTANGSFSTLTGATINATSVIDTPDIETATISARDGTTAINIADSTGNVSIPTQVTISQTGTLVPLTISSSDAGAGVAPTLKLQRDSASPAASDYVGKIQFTGEDDAGNELEYASIITQIEDPTDTSEDGSLNFYIQKAGSLVRSGEINATGLVVSDNLTVNGADVTITANIIHSGDTNTYFGFHGNDLWRVVTGGVERFEVSDSGIIVNDTAVATDFTVKSDNSANMLYVDGTNDRVGINEGTPTGAKLHVDAGASGDNAARFETGAAGGLELMRANNVGNGSTHYTTTYKNSDTDIATITTRNRSGGVASSGDIAYELQHTLTNASSYFGWFIGGSNYLELSSTGTEFNSDNGTNRLWITRTAGTRDQSGSFYTDDALFVLDSTQDEAGLSNGGFLFRSTNATNTNQNLAEFTQNGIIFNESQLADTDFRVESLNKNYMLFVDSGSDKVGIGGTTSPDALLHLWTQNSGSGTGGASGNADELLLENNSNCGLTILTENLASIHFGKEADNDIGKITYSMSSNDMTFTTNTAGNMTLRSDGDLSLSSSKHLNFNDKADMTAATQTTSTTAQTAIYSFSATTYTGAKLLVCVTDSTATERYITEILVTHDGTTAVSTEYGQVATDTALATFDVDISGGNVRLLATPASTNSMTFKVMSTQLLA